MIKNESLATECPRMITGWAIMKILVVILAIANAIPIIDKWLAELAILYAKTQRDKNNVEFGKAMDDAITGKSTKHLQDVIGNKLDS
jgi:hypothetical protein